MRAGAKVWVQTIEQEVRERPTRLTTRAWTWTDSRDKPAGLTITTDRRLGPEEGGTRLNVAVEMRLDQPWRRPQWVLVGWLQRGAVRRKLEQQLRLIDKRLQAR